MAFYRDFPGEMIEHIELNDTKHSQQLTVNSNRIHENVATNNEELPKPTPTHDNGEDNDKHLRVGNTQSPMRRMAVGGKWGSSFWKDCQPTASQSGEESKGVSEYKGSALEESSDDAEDRMESESYQMKHKKVTGKGHQIVPADEMLSDEYYEQDGDEHSDTPNHRRTMNQSRGFGLRMPPRPVALSAIIGKSKLLKANRYGHEDADFEDADNDDDKDGDDPDDADFDPDYGAADEHWGTKDRDEDWDAEESDEEDNGKDDDLDISDEDDIYIKKSRANHSLKSGRTSKSTRERSLAPSARSKSGRTVIEEDEKESSAENSEYYSDDGFRSARRDLTARRKNGGRSSSINASAWSNELRTSGRSVQKVSYVESDEGEDLDEGKKMRTHKVFK